MYPLGLPSLLVTINKDDGSKPCRSTISCASSETLWVFSSESRNLMASRSVVALSWRKFATSSEMAAISIRMLVYRSSNVL